jgi:transcription initiation factor TFIIIB Brf1 subunit/transcription initiation factor TFIIB
VKIGVKALVRFGNLYLEVLNEEKIELVIIEKHRALSTILYDSEIEELFKVLGQFLIEHYGFEIAKVTDDLKELRRKEEEARKAKATKETLEYYQQRIKFYEEKLERLEKVREAMKKALEVIIFG